MDRETDWDETRTGTATRTGGERRGLGSRYKLLAFQFTDNFVVKNIFNTKYFSSSTFIHFTISDV